MCALLSADRQSQPQADKIQLAQDSFPQRGSCTNAETWTSGSDVPHPTREHRSQGGILKVERRALRTRL